MLVVACVAIIVVGPKDLPKMLRTVGNLTVTMNEQWATTVEEHLRAGRAAMAEGKARATSHQIEAAIHPALTSGDNFTTTFDGEAKDVDVLGTTISLELGTDDFKADMQIIGIDHYEL